MPKMLLIPGGNIWPRKYVPNPASIAVIELAQQQVAELVGEVLSYITDGKFDDQTCGEGDYFDSQGFRLKSKAKLAQDIGDLHSEFAIAGDLSVQPAISETRANIAEALESLERLQPASFSQPCSQRLLKNLDWATDARHRIVQHLVDVQSKYILEPDNKLLLHRQTQRDVAEGVELSAPTVSRLVKLLSVSFPDNSVHPVSSLIPGSHIERIWGEHILGLLKDDCDLYDPERGWLVSSAFLARKIFRRFGINYSRRTVHNYIANLGDRKDQ